MRHGPARAALLACAATAWPLSAAADTLTDAECAAPLTTGDAALCMSAEYARLDAALDRLHADTLAHLAERPAARIALDDAQTAWQRVRARDCDAAFAIAIDGSGRNDARLTCLLDHTRLRIGQLQRLRAL